MNTFQKSQAAKLLACYTAPEEIQKGDDSEKISMTKKDFKEEHENLIKVLESPSKEDDKEEIKEQEKEAKDYGVELEKASTFEKSQSAKLLACYLSEDDIEKAHPVGYINKNGYQKQADGKYKYVGKNKASNASSDVAIHEDAKKIAEHAGITEKEYQSLHPGTKKELYNNMRKEKKPESHDDSSIKLGREVTLASGKGVIMDVDRDKRVAKVNLESGKAIKVKFDDIHANTSTEENKKTVSVKKEESNTPKSSETTKQRIAKFKAENPTFSPKAQFINGSQDAKNKTEQAIVDALGKDAVYGNILTDSSYSFVQFDVLNPESGTVDTYKARHIPGKYPQMELSKTTYDVSGSSKDRLHTVKADGKAESDSGKYNAKVGSNMTSSIAQDLFNSINTLKNK